jgi:8-oxo-dGTP diphosphatase
VASVVQKRSSVPNVVPAHCLPTVRTSQELFETWEECARREVEEEMGISNLDDVRWGHVTNDMMRDEDRHYVTIFMLARTSEEPQNLEPHKCDGWNKYSWDDLVRLAADDDDNESKAPRDAGVTLFGPLRQLVRDDPAQVREYLLQKGR